MHNQVATFEQSVRLKELGFPQNTLLGYETDGTLRFIGSVGKYLKYIAAPTLHEMMQFAISHYDFSIHSVYNEYRVEERVFKSTGCISTYFEGGNPTHVFADFLIKILEERNATTNMD